MIKLREILLDEKIVYHGTISDFVDAIEKSKVLKSPRGGAKKISGGYNTELGLIWVTPEERIAHSFAHGFEAGMWTERGLKVDYGGIVELEIEDNLKLLDRYSPLTQKQVDILNKKYIPPYKPLKAGDAIINAEHRVARGVQLHDMLRDLGYDGITMSNGKQIGIARDELPIKVVHRRSY